MNKDRFEEPILGESDVYVIWGVYRATWLDEGEEVGCSELTESIVLLR